MRFAFTAQQREFQDAVRQVLAKECTTADLRAAFASPTARSPRWATLADMGMLGLCVPEEDGGLGLGLVDTVLVLEEAGRVSLPEPLAETAAVAAPLLAELAASDAASGSASDAASGSASGSASDSGSDTASARARAHLAALAAGDVAVAVAEWSPGTSGTSGTSGRPVAGADGADLLILVADGEGGPEVHALARDQVEVTPVVSLDPTRRLGLPSWTPSSATRIAAGTDAADALSRTADRAAVATAAQLVGLADRMIGMTADYAKTRQQFGRPIGSFQAVKHLLAGAQVALEFARPVVYAAAWALDEAEPDASRTASTAKALASDAASEAARVALQVHGAIGYTWECDLHLFLKRTWALAEAWGSAADHRTAVLDSLIAPT